MQNLLSIAAAEIGVKEITGKNANKQILNYAKECGFKDYVSDETAWCSLFVNWVAHKAGMKRSNSLAARSWLNAGMPVENPEPGDIVIFWREKIESWQGHVGIFVGFSSDGSRIYSLGGNQGNQVSITAYPRNQLLGFRRLLSADKVIFKNKVLKIGSTGEEVIKLQDSLKQLGFNCGTSDGRFGPLTEKALKEFQSTNKEVAITGIFEKTTREFMERILNS